MDLSTLPAILIAILGGSGVGSLIGAIASWKIATRKLESEIKDLNSSSLLKEAEAQKTIGEYWRGFSEPLLTRLNDLTNRLDRMQEERELMRANYEKRIQKLIEQYEEKIQHLEDQVSRLRREVGRLRNYIRKHGLDPGEEA